MRLLSGTELFAVFAVTGLLLAGCDLHPSGSAARYRATASSDPPAFGTVRPTDTTLFAGATVTFGAAAVEDTVLAPNTAQWTGGFVRWVGLPSRLDSVALRRDTVTIDNIQGNLSLTAVFAGFKWRSSRVEAVSNTGAIAAESLFLGEGGDPVAFRATLDGESTVLGTLGGASSEATDISSAGTSIVGFSTNSDGAERAFRWVETDTIDGLGTLGGDQSRALGVSSGGSVVVGWAETAEGAQRAFRWTSATGMDSLGTLGGASSVAADVAVNVPGADTVIVGHSTTGAGEEHVFRWTPEAGMEDLGALAGGTVTVHAVSDDGSTIVGTAQNAQGNLRAFRWTRPSGLESLGALGRQESRALDVSAGGSVIVGKTEDSNNLSRAFRWTPENGMEDLNEVYGPLLENREELFEALISPNGRFVTGLGFTEGTGTHSYLVYRGLPR